MYREIIFENEIFMMNIIIYEHDKNYCELEYRFNGRGLTFRHPLVGENISSLTKDGFLREFRTGNQLREILAILRKQFPVEEIRK